MKIYTKSGDDGSTGLVGGVRTEKDAPRVAAYGCVDELNCHIGSALVVCTDSTVRASLERISHELFSLGADLATAAGKLDSPRITAREVEALEKDIDLCWHALPALRQFILPGGTELAARLHIARAVCRRAERECITLARTEPVAPHSVIYLNRLSDLLFTLARYANRLAGTTDIPWRGE